MYTGKDLQQGASYHKLVTKIHLFSDRQEVDAFYQHGKFHDCSNQRDLGVNSGQDDLRGSDQT